MLLIGSMMLPSCATILGGKLTDCQKQKPSTGSRQVRVGFLVADLFFGVVPLVVDFATGAVYKPCK